MVLPMGGFGAYLVDAMRQKPARYAHVAGR